MMMGITGAFSSLGINERSCTPRERLSKDNSTSSLPNLVLLERSTAFIRNVCDDDEIESTEQPIDFSKKYCETKTIKADENCTFNNVVKSYNNSFTMYAETDLDQPTDYSLRYAEDDSDSERCKLPKPETAEFVQDTIKTYCTEDTPYETPFNFSTSTSMSDLRIDDKSSKLDDSKDVTVISAKAKKSVFSSGLMSPEKPVNYCEEGTPGYFSRVASCGSLNSLSVNDPSKQEPKEENLANEKKELRRSGKFPSETKAVKFEEVVNYAEETPLMFSRSSSLASLDSIEQHSIHDDRSSVVSDFSRLTSGAISPSELPDSPSQTVPPSPKPGKNQIVFPPILKKKTGEITETVPNVAESSVFEDVVKKFKVETTPLQFSTATSLSSLIGDDSKTPQRSETKKEVNLDLSEDSEDEDILAACINIGMQNNRYSQTKSNIPPSSEATLSFKLPQHSDIIVNSARLKVRSKSETVLLKSDVTSDSVRTYCTEDTPAALSNAGSNSNLTTLSLDEAKNLDETSENNRIVMPKRDNLQKVEVDDMAAAPPQETNENTDGSQKDKNSRRSSFLCLSDDSDESEKALLEECILAGMLKNSSTVATCSKTNEIIGNESSDDDEDTKILESCIKIGMKNNRYTKSTVPLDNNIDAVKSYCTEDTPAVLSHAGSCSNLSVLSLQDNENNVKDYFSDLNSNFSDEDDERLLEECVKFGMATITGKLQLDNLNTEGTPETEQKTKETPPNGDGASVSSLTDDDSSEFEEILLEQCIRAGMPKTNESSKPETNDLTPAEKSLLQQCILEGMKKCRPNKKTSEEDTTELTEAEEALLRQCILSGMPRNKNLAQGGPSTSRESADLTESERLLLQQCILAGMPKSRSKLHTAREIKKHTWKRGKELERNGPGHTCCVHCPRNNGGRTKQNGHVRTRRRYREREVVQVREGREVNMLYVTSQILNVQKEVIDRSYGKWV